jgi:regulator of replication initiation timing
MKCLACPFTISDIELLVCVLCKGTYHHNCVNITTAEYKANSDGIKRDWQCPSCNNVTSRRKGAENTPVRGLNQFGPRVHNTEPSGASGAAEANDEQLSETRQTDMSCDASLLDLDNDSYALGNRPQVQQRGHINDESYISYNAFAALIEQQFNQFRSELYSHFTTQLNSFRLEVNSSTNSLLAEIKGLKQKVDSVTGKINALELENAALKSELAECKSSNSPANDTQALHEKVSRLELQLDERDQATLVNDLEISGVPELKEESTVHIVMALATKIGVRLEEGDIVSADRVGPVREAAPSEGSQPARPRPRPLVVRLARRALRDALLKGARVRRGATTEGIGLSDHIATKFHIHDRLTKNNRVLFKARERGRSEQWRFIWTKEGRIYARKSESSKVHRIRAETDLDRFFTVASTNLNA